jgi:hypothetical protein
VCSPTRSAAQAADDDGGVEPRACSRRAALQADDDDGGVDRVTHASDFNVNVNDASKWHA